ncbi:MAG: ribosome silencing factor [Candidatus Binatia bacterium]
MNVPPSPSEFTLLIADAVAGSKASDIVLLDVSQSSSLADWFVLSTARSAIHVRAVCEQVEHAANSYGVRASSREGVEFAHWALLDYGDVVVHVFQNDTRRLYDLERLWHKAPRSVYREGRLSPLEVVH